MTMTDNRASIGIIRFFLSLIAGAVVVWIVWEVANPILDGARGATNNAEANQGTEWFQLLVDNLPITFLMIAFFGLIALAVFQREVLT
jgi:hypothetical protein